MVTCYDHYSDKNEAESLCREQQSLRTQQSMGGAKWVDGKPCDRTGAALGCRSDNGYTATWFYPRPGASPAAYDAKDYCTGLVAIDTAWQPGKN